MTNVNTETFHPLEEADNKESDPAAGTPPNEKPGETAGTSVLGMTDAERAGTVVDATPSTHASFLGDHPDPKGDVPTSGSDSDADADGSVRSPGGPLLSKP